MADSKQKQKVRTPKLAINLLDFCLPKGRLSEVAHEIQGCSSQKCSRGGIFVTPIDIGGTILVDRPPYGCFIFKLKVSFYEFL